MGTLVIDFEMEEPIDAKMQVVSEALLHLSKTSQQADVAHLAKQYHLSVCDDDSGIDRLAHDGKLLEQLARLVVSFVYHCDSPQSCAGPRESDQEGFANGERLQSLFAVRPVEIWRFADLQVIVAEVLHLVAQVAQRRLLSFPLRDGFQFGRVGDPDFVL